MRAETENVLKGALAGRDVSPDLVGRPTSEDAHPLLILLIDGLQQHVGLGMLLKVDQGVPEKLPEFVWALSEGTTDDEQGAWKVKLFVEGARLTKEVARHAWIGVLDVISKEKS